MPRLRAAVLVLLLLPAAAQDREDDPYTAHDPARMAKAGVVALQAFVWGGGHTTRDIQSLMGWEPFRFLETAHFKLAVALSPMAMPAGGVERDALRRELAGLRASLPGIDPDTRVLDGWARAHLYAHRLEALYADFARRFGVTPAQMAKARPGSASASGYAGEGPYLGMREKYLVLLCRDSGAVNAYLRNFLDRPAPRTSGRYVVGGGAALLLATAESMPDEDLREDRTLHAAVVHHGAHMLLDGFRSYWHDCPTWFEEGVAHWFRVQAVADRAYFSCRPQELPIAPSAKPWSVKVAQRLALRGSVSAARLFALDGAAAMTFEEHLAAWSRVDFLLRAHAEAFPILARSLKGPDPARIPPVPSAAAVCARQAGAIASLFGWEPEDFDAAWAEYVTKTYARGGKP